LMGGRVALIIRTEEKKIKLLDLILRRERERSGERGEKKENKDR